MRITIDTKEDTQDEIRKVIEILSAITQSGNVSGESEPQPVVGEGIFGMFSNNPESPGGDRAAGSTVAESGGETAADGVITDYGKKSVEASTVPDSAETAPAAGDKETEGVRVVLNERKAGEETGEAKVVVSESREETAVVESGEVSGVSSENRVESVDTPEPSVVENVKRDDNDAKIIPY